MSAAVLDVTESEFPDRVLARSKQVPVLVDFWAPWCGPCRVLGPILEKVAREAKGAFELVKVNTDESPNLSAAMRISSIPAVYLFSGGRPVDGFIGALGERDVRDFLARHVRPPSADRIEDAEERLAAGDPRTAKTILDGLLQKDGAPSRARYLRARIAYDENDDATLRRQVEAIPPDAREAKPAAALVDARALRSECGDGEATWRKRLADAPADPEARYHLACCLGTSGRTPEALDLLLEGVRLGGSGVADKSRKAMVTFLNALGPESDLARDYRRRLAMLL